MIERAFDDTEFSNVGYMFGFGVVPAIRGFDMGYTSSDHHIKEFHLGPHTRSPIPTGDYLITFKDNDVHRAISGSVKLVDMRSMGSHLEVSRDDCRGECRLRIPHLTSSEAFILTGFALRRESDAHVREVKVRQMAHNDHIYVKLVDNSESDTYYARITYAVVPRSALGPLTHVRSEVPARGSVLVPRPPGTAVLQSFSFRFIDGDRHLQRMSVDLTGDDILLRFRDQRGDDRFEWMVEYSVMP